MIQLISGILVIITLIFVLIFAYYDKRKKRNTILNPKVSIIVPCFNDSKSIKDTIESIYEVCGNLVDLIVINDASTDNSESILNELSHKYNFTFINNKINLGKSQTLNEYYKLAKHETILFVDADVIMNKKSFNDTLLRLKSKKVGAVSCPYVPKNKGFIPLMQNLEYNMISLVQGSYNLFSGMSLWGGFIGIKRIAFEDAGKFSLNAITEDLDLAFKLNESGWKVEQSFFAVKTEVPDTIKTWFKQKLRWSSGGFQCFAKHYMTWLKNPIYIFFMVSYSVFMISNVFVLSNKIFFIENLIKSFYFINETFSLLTSLKLTGLLYSVYLIKDLLWVGAFTFLSVPYTLPLIKNFKKVYLIWLIIPFSIVYIPIFSLIYVIGSTFYIYKSPKLAKTDRGW